MIIIQIKFAFFSACTPPTVLFRLKHGTKPFEWRCRQCRKAHTKFSGKCFSKVAADILGKMQIHFFSSYERENIEEQQKKNNIETKHFSVYVSVCNLVYIHVHFACA